MRLKTYQWVNLPAPVQLVVMVILMKVGDGFGSNKTDHFGPRSVGRQVTDGGWMKNSWGADSDRIANTGPMDWAVVSAKKESALTENVRHGVVVVIVLLLLVASVNCQKWLVIAAAAAAVIRFFWRTLVVEFHVVHFYCCDSWTRRTEED